MGLCALPTLRCFNSGIWHTFKEFQHRSLKQLAESLQATVLVSRAQSTTNKYLLAYQMWVKRVQLYEEITPFPAQPSHIALYLQHLADSSESKSAIEEVVNVISWIHQLDDYSSMACRNPIYQSCFGWLSAQAGKA